MQPARGVDHDDVGARLDALVDSVEGDRRRVGALGSTHHLGAHARTPSLQLIGGGGAEGVGGPEHDASAVGDQHPRELADRGGLSSAVDADDQQHRRMVVMRQCTYRTVQTRLQLGDQHVPQHLAGIGLGVDVSAGELAAQLRHHRAGHGRAQVGNQQGVLDLLPGILIQVSAADDP